MTTDESITPVPTGLQLTALDPAFQDDPYPVLAELRATEPVHHDRVFERWVLTRHDDVDRIVQDRSLCVDPRKAAPRTFEAMFANRQEERERPPSMLFSDPPYHTHLRGLVNKAFTPRAVEAMRPRVEAIANELLDAVAGRDGFDIIADYSAPLPTIVIAEMLGVDPADRRDFKRWSDTVVMSFDPTLSPEMREKVQQADAELVAYLRRAIAERRQAPRDDLITRLIHAEEDGHQLNEDEIVTMTALLLAAGNLTTTDLIGNGVLALLQNPDQLAKLRANPDLIRNAVEEMLRYDPPVTQTGRITPERLEIDGHVVEAGHSINPQLAAANHDPAVYPDPDRFDITREDVHHHSFGGGAHYCLGAPLARLEAQVAVTALVQRFPDLRIAPGPIEHRRVPTFRGLVRLNVLV